jgi:hypothetical protein
MRLTPGERLAALRIVTDRRHAIVQDNENWWVRDVTLTKTAALKLRDQIDAWLGIEESRKENARG